MGPAWVRHETRSSGRRRACVTVRLDADGDDGQRRDGVAEAHPVALKEIGGDEGRRQSAEAEEEIHQVERRGAVRLAHAADQARWRR